MKIKYHVSESEYKEIETSEIEIFEKENRFAFIEDLGENSYFVNMADRIGNYIFEDKNWQYEDLK